MIYIISALFTAVLVFWLVYEIVIIFGKPHRHDFQHAGLVTFGVRLDRCEVEGCGKQRTTDLDGEVRYFPAGTFPEQQ